MNQFDELVLNASHVLQIVLLTCAQFILLDKLQNISALIVLTLPNMVQALCGDHIRIHTREKLFSCEECGQRFTQSSSRSRHIRTVHSTGQATLHQCPHCPYSTKYDASTLRRHILIHAREKLCLM